MGAGNPIGTFPAPPTVGKRIIAFPTMNSTPLQIDVVSDVVCPWCYVGKRRLEEALAQLGDEVPVEVTYHPFQLDPSVPKEGADFQSYMTRRFGGDVLPKFRSVEQAAETVGLDFNFAELPKAINTLALHRLLHVAREEGIGAEAKEALLKAYFVDRVDLTEDDTVAGVFAPLGWSREKTLDLLHSTQAEAEVRAEIRHYQQLGVSGVPFFIFNNKYAVSGAQPADVLLGAIRQAASELTVLTTDGPACDPATGVC
jgi:predicted DsbA family dithiol-disulfide isomerase